MKKIIGYLMAMALLPIALMIGCGSSNTPTSNAAPTATSVPAVRTNTATMTVSNTPCSVGGNTCTFTFTPTITNTATVTSTYTATNTVTLTVTSTITSSPTAQAAQATVNLGSAANYVVLSYTGISNSGSSSTCGGYGVYPYGQTSVTGPAISENCSGAIDVGDPTANTAKQDLGYAYTDASTRPNGATLAPGADIGGQTLYEGLYTEGGVLNISQADLTLDAQNNANAVFIFQVSSNLIVGPGRHVILTNRAQAANVYWAVAGYCSLDTTVQMVGNIMAYTSVTFNTGASLIGRALAENGDVTLLANNVSHP